MTLSLGPNLQLLGKNQVQRKFVVLSIVSVDPRALRSGFGVNVLF